MGFAGGFHAERILSTRTDDFGQQTTLAQGRKLPRRLPSVLPRPTRGDMGMQIQTDTHRTLPTQAQDSESKLPDTHPQRNNKGRFTETTTMIQRPNSYAEVIATFGDPDLFYGDRV